MVASSSHVDVAPCLTITADCGKMWHVLGLGKKKKTHNTHSDYITSNLSVLICFLNYCYCHSLGKVSRAEKRPAIKYLCLFSSVVSWCRNPLLFIYRLIYVQIWVYFSGVSPAGMLSLFFNSEWNDAFMARQIPVIPRTVIVISMFWGSAGFNQVWRLLHLSILKSTRLRVRGPLSQADGAPLAHQLCDLAALCSQSFHSSATTAARCSATSSRN